MRRILSVKEYRCALQALSADELRQAAAAYAQAAEELMDRHGLHRALFLCAKPFEPLAKLAAECLGIDLVDQEILVGEERLHQTGITRVECQETLVACQCQRIPA